MRSSLMKTILPLVLCAAGLLSVNSGSAAELYNLDFLAPETGNYTITFGTPTVLPTVGPLSRALVFDAVASYEQIQLAVGGFGPHYNLAYDVLVHDLRGSQYGFTMLLDTPQVRTVTFHGGLNQIDFFNPLVTGGTIPTAFANDTVYHMGVAIDFPTNRWTVAVNGTERLNQPINATQLSSIRFSMAPVFGGAVDAPGIYAALDNVVLTVTPEPSAGLLAGMAGMLWLALRRFRRAATA
jgi:hypothetical protein